MFHTIRQYFDDLRVVSHDPVTNTLRAQGTAIQPSVSGGGTTVVAAAARVFVNPAALITAGGTPTLTVVNNIPVMQLPDAANTSLSFSPPLDFGTGYECYIWLSATAANNAITLGMDLSVSAEGSAIPAAPTTKLFSTVPVGASANAPLRYQLPLGAQQLASPRSIISIRITRYGGNGTDTSSAVLNIHGVEFVPVVAAQDATVTNGNGLAAAVFKTPYEGVTVTRRLSIYTPIWTAPDGVYVCEPVTIAGTQQSRVAKLSKGTYTTLADVQITARAHDGIEGHRDASVCVDAAGNVILHGEAHHIPFEGKLAAAGNLASLSALTAPSGTATNCSYRKFFRNPYDGSIWMGCRGDSYTAAIYKWNGTDFVRTSAQQLADAGGNCGFYGMEIAFASATTVYVTVEPMSALSGSLSGYPRQNLVVLKSTDSGATWTSVGGRSILLPFALGQSDSHAFPTFNKLHTVVSARIAVASDGNPVVVAAWKHPSDTLRSLWVSKWDGTQWVRRRLMPSNGNYSTGNPHLAYLQNGTIYVSVSWEDDHDNGSSGDGGTSSERAPNPGPLYIFKSSDGLTWTKHAITGVPEGGYGGAYLDPEAPRLDGVLRMLARRETEQTASEIWELPLP